MSGAVISANTSIKSDPLSYKNNLGVGAGTNYVTVSANNNQYFEIYYLSLTITASTCSWNVFDVNTSTVLYSSGIAASHLVDGITQNIAGNPVKIIVPNGCALRITSSTAHPTTIILSGIVFSNSP